MTTFSLIDPQTDGRPRSRLCEIESTTHPKRSVDKERQVSRLIMTYLCKHLYLSYINLLTVLEFKCFLITTPTTATSRVQMYLWDCQCALIAWRHTFCLHCANGSSLLGCPVANTNRHSKTNGILIELWQHSLYGVYKYKCVRVCALAFAGIYAKLCKEHLSISIEIPETWAHNCPSYSHFIYANMSTASVFGCVCVGGAWQRQQLNLCCALQNNNLKCAMRFVVVMSVRSDDNKPSPIGVFHTSPGQAPV